MTTFEFEPIESSASLVFKVTVKENNVVSAQFSVCVNNESDKELAASEGYEQLKNPPKNY